MRRGIPPLREKSVHPFGKGGMKPFAKEIRDNRPTRKRDKSSRSEEGEIEPFGKGIIELIGKRGKQGRVDE